MIFHCFVNATVPCSTKYLCDAYNAYARKFTDLMHKNGHTVWFYSNSAEVLPCTNFVQVLSEADYEEIEKSVGSLNNGIYLCYSSNDQNINDFKKRIQTVYCEKVIEIMKKNRSQTNEQQILFHFFNCTTKPIADAFKELPSVEQMYGCPAITYNNVIFPSSNYANVMIRATQNIPKNWTVLPPLFDISEFKYVKNNTEKRKNKILYLGRIQTAKGIDIVFKLAKLKPTIEFLVAGYYEKTSLNNNILDVSTGNSNECIKYDLNEYPNIVLCGYADLNLRKKLLSECMALIQPSNYDEPFGFNVVESYLSGTPVITSNRGTFKNTVIQGVTGFRCDTLDDYCGAIRDIANDKISTGRCRKEGLKYDMNKLYQNYMIFFNSFFKIQNYVDCSIESKNNTSLIVNTDELKLATAYKYISCRNYTEAHSCISQITNRNTINSYEYNNILGIVSYYTGQYRTGLEGCQKAIVMKNMDLDKSNLEFYKAKINELPNSNITLGIL